MKQLFFVVLRWLGLEEVSSHLWRSLQAYRAAEKLEKKRVHDANALHALAASGTNTKLHIGAGFNILPGWMNTDLNSNEVQSLVMDAGRPLPIPAQTLTHVFCEHLIEHLPRAQGLQLIQESFRCLRLGGKIRIATPNLEFYVSLFQLDAKHLEFLRLYGELLNDRPMTPTKAINHAVRDWGHEFLWSESELRAALTHSGFIDITQHGIGQSDDPELSRLERHQETVNSEVNRQETLILEATKPIV